MFSDQKEVVRRTIDTLILFYCVVGKKSNYLGKTITSIL